MTREPSLGLVTTHRDDDSDDDSDSDDGAAVSLTPDSGSDQGAVTGPDHDTRAQTCKHVAVKIYSF